MGLSIERNGFTNIESMGFQLVTDLTQNGFEVIAADKLETSQFTNETNHYVLKPSTDIDPLASELAQPWLLVLEFNNTSGYINSWVLTPTQIEKFDVTSYAENAQSGRLSVGNTTSSDRYPYFWSRNSEKTLWSCYRDQETDRTSIPLSYQLCLTDHGLFFGMWAESYNSTGDCFSWILIQRPVNCQTGQIVTNGKSPLICVFSQHGIERSDLSNNVINSRVYNSILKFVVREEDVNKPTVPCSAVVPTADSDPIINPIQQTSFSEDGNYTIRIPHGITTSRYIYDYKLDMIAYTSADALSQWSKPMFTLFGEESPRTYKALNANFPNNTGMRLLCQIDGKGF